MQSSCLELEETSIVEGRRTQLVRARRREKKS